MSEFPKVRLILRSIYLKGYQDGNLKTADMSWEETALASLRSLVKREIENIYKSNGLDYGQRFIQVEEAIDKILERLR